MLSNIITIREMPEAVQEITTLGVTTSARLLSPIAFMKSLLLRRPLRTNLTMVF